jgi:ethanolamine ammonia-lyase large subunit
LSGWWFSLVSSTNITEILLKVVLNTITLTRLLDRHSVNYEDDKLTLINWSIKHKTINFVNQFIIFFPHDFFFIFTSIYIYEQNTDNMVYNNVFGIY